MTKLKSPKVLHSHTLHKRWFTKEQHFVGEKKGRKLTIFAWVTWNHLDLFFLGLVYLIIAFNNFYHNASFKRVRRYHPKHVQEVKILWPSQRNYPGASWGGVSFFFSFLFLSFSFLLVTKGSVATNNLIMGILVFSLLCGIWSNY